MKEDNLRNPLETKIRKLAIAHFCQYFLCAFLLAIPLRIKMFSIMKFGKNLVFEPSANGKSFFHNEKGDWHLRFKSAEFKNANHSAKRGLDVRCAAWLSPIIQEYIDVYRPLTIGASQCDYVFRPVGLVSIDAGGSAGFT